MTSAKHYLFDWGDTLMVDTPNQTGPMCDWPEVKVVEGALSCLKRLSQHVQCHVATNAQDSTEAQIRLALKRVGLSEYIEHVFCRENLGVGKTSAAYFSKITSRLNVSADCITMVGDSLERDVLNARRAGINEIWYNPKNLPTAENVQSVTSLDSLI
jgi:putative hydrolase of the HAD superfamily